MLNLKIDLKTAYHLFIAYLTVISLITIHSFAFADPATKTAEEYRVQGFTAHNRGDLREALAYYSKAMSLGMENVKVLNDMGVLYEHLNLQQKAEEFYLKAIRIDETYLPAYTNLAYLYQSFGNQEKAFEYFKKRYEKAESGDPWAEKVKAELLKIHPEYADTIQEMEIAQLTEDMVQHSHQEFQDRVQRAHEHNSAAATMVEHGAYRNALDEFDRALQLTPESPEIIRSRRGAEMALAKQDIEGRYNKALYLLDDGDIGLAKRELKKIVDELPGEPDATYQRAKQLSRKRGAPVHEEYNDLIALSIEHYQKGLALMGMQDYPRAIGELNRALVLTPKNPRVIEALAEARIEMAKISIQYHSEQVLEMLDYGDAVAAESEIAKMLTVLPQDELPRWDLRSENPGWATEAYVDFEDHLKRSQDYQAKGLAFTEAGEFTKALAEFNRALKLTPNNPQVIEARKEAKLELMKKNIKERSEQAIELINKGDSVSARHEIRDILTSIPNDPDGLSAQE